MVTKTIKLRLSPDKLGGILPNKGDSVKELKETRKRLSKEKFDLKEINKLAN